MNTIKTAILAGLAGLTASAATAADLPRRILLPRAPVLDTTENWYLRGDVGYTHYKRPEADFALAALEGSMAREGFRDSAVIGAGIGYRFSPLLRADVTLDHRFRAHFKGLPSDVGIATGSVVDRGRFQSSTLMLNAYADLGTYKGLTPYLGAGIGFARNTLDHYTRTDAVLGTVEHLTGEDDYDLAWALMAGVGYKLSNDFTLDLGYRYVSLGDVKTGGYDEGAGADVESIGSHEVRLGVRYAFP